MRSSFAKAMFTTLVLSALAPLAVIATDAIDRPYDWTVEIKTEKMERHFEYEGSTLKPVSRADIRYYPMHDEDNKTDYEEVWFHHGKALGLERKNKFELPEGEGIAIKVSHKTDTPDEEEIKAAADAISLVYLDSYLHRNPIVTVIVKNPVFHNISNALQEQQWQILPDVTDTAIDAQVILYLQSEDGETKQTFKYQSPES